MHIFIPYLIYCRNILLISSFSSVFKLPFLGKHTILKTYHKDWQDSCCQTGIKGISKFQWSLIMILDVMIMVKWRYAWINVIGNGHAKTLRSTRGIGICVWRTRWMFFTITILFFHRNFWFWSNTAFFRLLFRVTLEN